MKSNTTVGLTVMFATATVVFLFGVLFTACSGKSDPSPVVKPSSMDGWNGMAYEPASEYTTFDNNRISGSMCKGDPQDVLVDVWYFDPGKVGDDAIDELKNQGFDDQGDQMDTPDTDNSFDVKVDFRAGSVVTSNYNKSGTFDMYLRSGQLVVFRCTTDVGVETWSYLLTTSGTTGEICF